RAGRGGLTLIVGEAGAGRTALLRAFAETANFSTLLELDPNADFAAAIDGAAMPLLVIIDDLQTAPANAIQALGDASRAARSAPILVIASARMADPTTTPEAQAALDHLARDATTVAL